MVSDSNVNKKVLLRERKRHTANRTASVHCADLSWLGSTYPGLGVPTLAREGYLPWPGGTYPGWEGVPALVRGYLPWPRVPTLVRGCLPMLGYLLWPRGYLPWLVGTYLARVPPLGVDREMPVKTVPSPIVRMRAVKHQRLIRQSTFKKHVHFFVHFFFIIIF